MRNHILLAFIFVLIITFAGYSQELDKASRIELIEKSFEDSRKALEVDPDNLKLKKEFIFCCAFLKKWDELLPIYMSIRGELEEKDFINDLILFTRTNQIKNENIIIEINEGDPKGRFGFTIIMEYLNANSLNNLLEEEKNKIWEHVNKGYSLIQKGLFAEGQKEMKASLKIHETPIPYLYLGMSSYLVGNLDDAIYNFEECINMTGRENVMPTLYVILSTAYKDKGDLQKSINILEEQINDDTSDLFLLYNLAHRYLEAEKKAEFIETCEKIKSLDKIIFSLLELDYNKEVNKINALVSSVEIEGNERISTDEIIGWIKTKAGQSLDKDFTGQDLVRLYATGLFADVSVDYIEIDNGVKVIFKVKEKAE